jgi:heme exporter protein D
MSQGFFFGAPGWHGGASGSPPALAAAQARDSLLVLPGSAEGSALIRALTVNGKGVDLSRYAGLHFLARRCAASPSAPVKVSVQYGDGSVSQIATVTLGSEGDCWSPASVNLVTLAGSAAALQDVEAFSFSGGCLGVAQIMLDEHSDTRLSQANYTAATVCARAAAVEYPATISPYVWLGVAFGVVALLALIVAVAVLVSRKRTRRRNSLVAPENQDADMHSEPDLNAIM